MNKKLKDIYIFALMFFFVDQLIKFYLSTKMIENQSIMLIRKFLNITYVHNTGAAFSLLEGNTWLLILIGIIAVICFSYYIWKLEYISDFDIFNYSLLLGGVFGNLIDRIVRGYVIDYISLNIFGYHFPIFNFADMCIVISVLLIFCSTVKGDLWKE